MLVSMDALDLSLVAPDSIRRISRIEYEQMVKAGILAEDERVELLRGVIVSMSPPSWNHDYTIEWLNERFVLALQGLHGVRPQLGFAADEWSLPQPDLAVVRKDPTRREHPTDALLLVEVSLSSLRKDRKVKQVIYAENGVPEYWIVDVEARAIEVYTDPAPGGYRTKRVFHDGDVVRPALIPEIEIAVAELPR